ncbi:GNAT family N-acetyltransferase [Fictibacillus nanhaiensis]|uniref:GNAT family N-acetyltransferase n=1 Tax=Fictibacillus nanhaiensis TaxID=742169 RepID=UPI001C95B458|nr:GNAT family N-acetyltransferase [Fictibacillus nanhaiensis]MBY6037514.1 GNAT family N-acetyltransferase [Fictibacillus nanhaiensis]
MKKNQLICKKLNVDDLHEDFLEKFDRYQVTNQVWFNDNNKYKVKADHFTEQWDTQKKEFVTESLRKCVNRGGVVIGIFHDKQLTGFANVENTLFGSKKEYVEMSYIHVSYEHRGLGMGKSLFKACCDEALILGAKKLYIAAHPSIETQAFYHSVGCRPALEINQDILDKEPLDIQLEKIL